MSFSSALGGSGRRCKLPTPLAWRPAALMPPQHDHRTPAGDSDRTVPCGGRDHDGQSLFSNPHPFQNNEISTRQRGHWNQICLGEPEHHYCQIPRAPQSRRQDSCTVQQAAQISNRIGLQLGTIDLAGCHKQQQSHIFSKIPAEIRNNIFALALQEREDVHSYNHLDGCPITCLHIASGSLNLLATCKLVYYETQALPTLNTTLQLFLKPIYIFNCPSSEHPARKVIYISGAPERELSHLRLPNRIHLFTRDVPDPNSSIFRFLRTSSFTATNVTLTVGWKIRAPMFSFLAPMIDIEFNEHVQQVTLEVNRRRADELEMNWNPRTRATDNYMPLTDGNKLWPVVSNDSDFQVSYPHDHAGLATVTIVWRRSETQDGYRSWLLGRFPSEFAGSHDALREPDDGFQPVYGQPIFGYRPLQIEKTHIRSDSDQLDHDQGDGPRLLD